MQTARAEDLQKARRESLAALPNCSLYQWSSPTKARPPIQSGGVSTNKGTGQPQVARVRCDSCRMEKQERVVGIFSKPRPVDMHV